MLEKESNLNTNKVSITIKKIKDNYSREEVDRLLDEQASKTTAEMLENLKTIKVGKKLNHYCLSLQIILI